MKSDHHFKLFLVILALSLFANFYFDKFTTRAGTGHNVEGFAWAGDDSGGTPGGIGWLSFNSIDCDTDGNGTMSAAEASANTECPAAGTTIPNYGVSIEAATGLFSGHAWSENIGWLKFDEGCPTSIAGQCQAKLDTATNKVTGWARFCAGTSAGDCSASNPDATAAGGWDGWVSLHADNDHASTTAGVQTSSYSYGVTRNASTGKLEGYAWAGASDGVGADAGLGWIQFNPSFGSGVKYSPPAAFSYTIALSSSSGTVLTGLSAPSKLRLSSVGVDTVTLSWSDNSSNETGFKIERATGSGSFSQIASVGAGVTTYTNNSGLTANSGYTYRIRAYNADGDSGYTNMATVNTSGAARTVTHLDLYNSDTDTSIETLGSGMVLNLALLPSNITVVAETATVSATIGSVNFTHDGSSIRNEGVAPYAIAGDSSGDFSAWTGNPTVGSHNIVVTPYSASGGSGTPGTAVNFNYAVINSATADGGLGGLSSVITLTKSGGTAESVALSASGLPTGATASFSPASCTPNITCVSTMTLTVPESLEESENDITISGSPAPEANQTYTLAVISPPPPTEPPEPPAVVSASTSGTCGGKIDITWSAVTGATSYNIYRSATATGIYSSIRTGEAGLSYTDTTPLAGTLYYYKVSAVNAVGEGALSTAVSAQSSVTCPPTAIEISRIGSSGSTNAYVANEDGSNPNPATPSASNPLKVTGLTAGNNYRAYATNLSGYKIEVRSCSGDCNLSLETYSNITSSCSGSYCSVVVQPENQETTLVEYKYTPLLTTFNYTFSQPNPVTVFQGQGGFTDVTATLTSTGSTENQTYIAAGSTWKYEDDGSNQGTAWRATSFNDGSWSQGAAVLGYGESGLQTTISSSGITKYFRKSFTVDDPSTVTALTLELVKDDGAVVYLNGTEVMRSGMPAGTIAYNTLANYYADGANESVWWTPGTPVSPSLLVAGTNVIAVEVHQENSSSSDMRFNLKLDATITNPSETQPIIFSAIGIPAGVSGLWSSDAPYSGNCSPTCQGRLVLNASSDATPGTYSITVSGTPLGETTVPKYFTLTIQSPSLTSLTCYPSKNPARPNESMQWTAAPNPSGTYDYTWSVVTGADGNPAINGVSGENISQLTTTYTTEGVRTVRVVVEGSNTMQYDCSVDVASADPRPIQF